MHTQLYVMPMAVSQFIVRFLTNLFLVFVKAEYGKIFAWTWCFWHFQPLHQKMQSHCDATICLKKSYECEKDKKKNGWTRICLFKIFVFFIIRNHTKVKGMYVFDRVLKPKTDRKAWRLLEIVLFDCFFHPFWMEDQTRTILKWICSFTRDVEHNTAQNTAQSINKKKIVVQ